jgi:hypothetical protein
MITRKYKIADKVVEVTSIYAEVHKYCSDYLTDEPADYSVTTTQADIDFECEKSAREDEVEGIPVRHFSDSYLEELAVYRKIAEKMIEYDTVLFHGSVIAVDGIGYLFTAKSGTGKSTHTRLWREYFGNRAVMVNDDKPLIRVDASGTATVYGTPWNGKHQLSRNIAVPVRAICLLERAEENRIEEITEWEALPALIGQMYRPADAKALEKTLDLIDLMKVVLYRLGCNMDISAARLSYQTLKE